MSKIVLAGLVKDKNLGDQIIYDSFKYLFNKQLKNFKDEDFRLLDLEEFNSIKKEDIYLIRKIKGFVNKFIRQNNEKRLNKLVDEYIKKQKFLYGLD